MVDRDVIYDCKVTPKHATEILIMTTGRNIKFGAFVRQEREEREIGLREMAEDDRREPDLHF